MGKRTRSQRQGSSPKNRVSSHRFPANNKLPRKFDEVGEIVDLIHSPAHTAPLAKIKFEDGTVSHFAAPEGVSVGQNVIGGETIISNPNISDCSVLLCKQSFIGKLFNRPPST